MSKKKNMYKLESLARLISGRTPEREQKEYYAETGTPWVKIENLDQGYIRETAEYLSEQGKEKVNLVPENSVLFSIVGTVGKVGIAGRELATNQQIVSLIFDETRVLPLYGYMHSGIMRKRSANCQSRALPVPSRSKIWPRALWRNPVRLWNRRMW